MKFRPKFFWKWSFFDQNQQLLQSVEPFERILRALFISQCPYKISSFLDRRNASHRFRLFSRDFRLFLFFFPGSACFSSLASPRNLPSWVKYYEKLESFGKEFRWTKFIAVERVTRDMKVSTAKYRNSNLLVPIQIERKSQCVTRGMKVSTEKPTLPKSSKSRNSNLLVPIQIERKSQYRLVPPDTEVWNTRSICSDHTFETSQILTNSLYKSQRTGRNFFLCAAFCADVCNTRSICSDHTFETSEILTNSLYKSQRTGRNFFLCAAFCAAFCADFCAFFLMGTAALYRVCSTGLR